jgi:F-type H+-transporting ATPase subunit epsilon
MVSAMRAGILEYRDEQDSLHHIYVGGGFVQVDKSGVTVLADEARAAAEVDIAEANALIETARRTLRGEDTSMTREEATVAIERATAQIKLGKR